MNNREYRFNNSTIKLVFGNIIESKSEVIVSSDDANLSMGGGVSRTIKKGAGSSIITDTSKFDELKLGDVVVTTAGELKQKYIFHCVTIGNIPDTFICNTFEKNKYVLEHTINKCFALVSMLNITSIAFPCIGGGVAKIPYVQVAKTMSELISVNLLNTNRILSVELYLYDRYQKMAREDFIDFFEYFAIKEHMNSKTILQKNDYVVTDNITLTDNVFVSYSRRDANRADKLCAFLNSCGIKCWIDKNSIHHGNNYKSEIVDAIASSKVFLFMSSINSNNSDNTIKEVAIAESMKKKIIPIRLDDTFYAI